MNDLKSPKNPTLSPFVRPVVATTRGLKPTSLRPMRSLKKAKSLNLRKMSKEIVELKTPFTK